MAHVRGVKRGVSHPGSAERPQHYAHFHYAAQYYDHMQTDNLQLDQSPQEGNEYASCSDVRDAGEIAAGSRTATHLSDSVSGSSTRFTDH